MESLGPDRTLHTVNGYAYWYGSGRLFVRSSHNENNQTSMLFRNMPEDADVQDIIRDMARKVQETVATETPQRNP
ncbi:MAG: hypothetical protein PHE68_02090 [Candidatus Peribacteraceae bacterium]|nr:hypothetical protein [Candidatus Peribacteraceae bacterium]MDD5075409.1 hypothetical protein [Candidatus Peribacteraceae bacterium]